MVDILLIVLGISWLVLCCVVIKWCCRRKIKREVKSMRAEIIKAVQKKADTKKQKIDASIVSRVASLTIDEVIKVLSKKFK